MQDIWQDFDDVMKEMRFEGYSMKQDPTVLNKLKSLWNNSMALNNNIQDLLSG